MQGAARGRTQAQRTTQHARANTMNDNVRQAINTIIDGETTAAYDVLDQIETTADLNAICEYFDIGGVKVLASRITMAKVEFPNEYKKV